jgi:hypothetical protein
LVAEAQPKHAPNRFALFKSPKKAVGAMFFVTWLASLICVLGAIVSVLIGNFGAALVWGGWLLAIAVIGGSLDIAFENSRERKMREQAKRLETETLGEWFAGNGKCAERQQLGVIEFREAAPVGGRAPAGA